MFWFLSFAVILENAQTEMTALKLLGLFENTSAGFLVFYSNTFRSHRISKNLLLFKPKEEFEFQISSKPEIPDCRHICLTFCTLEWKVRLFSLKTALHTILCPKAILASGKWSNKHSGISSHSQNGISKKSSEQGRVSKLTPFCFLCSTSL